MRGRTTDKRRTTDKQSLSVPPGREVRPGGASRQPVRPSRCEPARKKQRRGR